MDYCKQRKFIKYLSHTRQFTPVYQNATSWPIFVASFEIEILLQYF